LNAQNHCIVQRCDHGDNLSVRFHIENSISLTIAMPPRILKTQGSDSGAAAGATPSSADAEARPP
jgi:hypothetical protein